MNFRGGNWRDSRNRLHHIATPFSMHYISNYSTVTNDNQSDMKTSTDIFSDELHRLNKIPDPLKKNLADSVIIEQLKTKGTKTQTMMAQEFGIVNNGNVITSDNSESTPLSGITSFISSMFSMITGAVFQRRSDAYYDCYDSDARQRSPSLEPWQTSKISELNKNQRARSDTANPTDMTTECKTAADDCEQKLQKVHLKTSNNAGDTPPRTRIRRPKKVFVEAGMVEEKFEDAIEPEELVHIPNPSSVNCVGYLNHQNQELVQIDSPKMKTEVVPENRTDLNSMPRVDVQLSDANSKVNNETVELPSVIPKIVNESESKQSIKQEVVLSCEEKVNKLKALLQRQKQDSKPHLSNSIVTEDCLRSQKMHDKHFKNPNRLSCDKRKKSKLRKSIQDDMNFANEVADDSILNDTPSIEITEPADTSDGFDEVSGRFPSLSENDESFQIVFTDIPKTTRTRTVSDCDSEDSFIVFEDSPDSCFTSNDVFGDDTETESEVSDSESEVSDSGCISQLAHHFSRTISDLTDDSLYEGASEDQVDCAIRTVGDEVTTDPVVEEEVKSTGLLLDAKKKLLRKNQPPKKVHFSTDPPKVRVMRVWAFAARQARPGHWERHALDRERFKRRIADVEVAVSWVLKPQHRSRVMFQRFMPWWNHLRRQEIAERKQREAEEKLKKEMEEKRKAEEELRRKEEEELRKKEEEEKRIAEEEENRKKEEERLRVEAELKKLTYNNFNGYKLNGNSNVEAKDWSKCRQTQSKLVQRLVIARENKLKNTDNDKNLVKK